MALDQQIGMSPAEATHFDGFASVAGLKGDAESSILSLVGPRDNFTLLVGAEVTELLGSNTSPITIAGVRLSDGRELRAPHVFLAAGALHSPRLLSRYLHTSGLAATLPAAAHVGRNLKLHLLTALVAVSPRPKEDLIRKTVLLTHERFPHSSVQPLGFDAALIANLMPKFVPNALRNQIGRRAYGFFLQTEDGSDPRNRVRQSPNGSPPVLDFDEGRLPESMREHRSFTRTFQFALARAGLVSFTRRISLNGTAHVCGSLVCGSDAAHSVVDPSGRVHGLIGLYVVDGSILPRSSRVNPALTIYAWGLRVGDLVTRQFHDASTATHLSDIEVTHAS
jgi:choline dehydrogenase-like flavoprotein